MNNFFDNQRIFEIIWKRKFHFIIIGTVAVLLAAIFSGPAFIKPKYKSTARIYPTNLGEMSEESKTEQMLEVLNSNTVKLKIFNAFGGKDIFKIDQDDPHFMTYAFAIYDKNIKASKTPHETVEIRAMAYDPQIASDICDSIIHFYNQTVGNMYRAKNWELVLISQEQLQKKHMEADSLIERLSRLRTETGIVDVVNQVPEVTRGYVKALVEGGRNLSDVNRIKEIFHNALEKGAEMRSLEVSFDHVLQEIERIKAVYELNLNEYEKDITYSHVVAYPFAADEKSYPVRWIIVFFSALSAVFLALVVFLILDYKKEKQT
ncbi:MAG: Wzz/FepE/Etk N-terminal domain-containing protein [Prolixibacteraceae bacterium]